MDIWMEIIFIAFNLKQYSLLSDCRQYFQISQRDMKVLIHAVIVTAIFSQTIYSQSIIDFSYSQYIQKRNDKQGNPSTINIQPNRQLIQGYDFPSACSLATSLNNQNKIDSQELQSLDIDGLVDGLKADFTNLLAISERIKRKRQNVHELTEISARNTNRTILSDEEIYVLKKYEQRLGTINKEIQKNTQILDSMVYDSMRLSQNNQFVISALDFQIESLRLKYEYLNTLLKKATQAEKQKVDQDFNQYFADLKNKFDQQNTLVDDLNAILQNYNEVGILKGKISRLKGQVDVLNMMIDEKQQCVQERNQIRAFQKRDGQIKGLMENLRKRKQDRSSTNNHYCEGVAKKLQDRVKKVLLSYDYTFQCAEGLDELKQQRDNDIAELRVAELRLKQLQDSAGIDDYKSKFEQNRKMIKQKQEQISSFKINSYHHSPQEIHKLVQKVKSDLQAAEEKRKQIATSGSDKKMDYKSIAQLVQLIKRLKGNYCQEYERYQALANKKWAQVEQYEAGLEYQKKIDGVHQEQMAELKKLEQLFEQLKAKILQQLQ